MKYSRFESLVLAVGLVAVVGSLFFSTGAMPIFEEIVAQLLLLVVLLGAVHWGRKGGFVAATLASIIYIIMRIPLLVDQGGFSADVASLVLVRVLTYGLIGIVGGELCGRIKYVFAKMEDSSSVDDWSQVYNQRFIVRALEAALGQFRRYETEFSVVLIEMSDTLTAELRVSKQKAIVRGIANYIRNDIRLVDELGRLDDGTFIAVLPHTPREGATVVADRLHKGVCHTVGSKQESVQVEVLAAPADIDSVDSMHQELLASLPASVTQTAESAS